MVLYSTKDLASYVRSYNHTIVWNILEGQSSLFTYANIVGTHFGGKASLQFQIFACINGAFPYLICVCVSQLQISDL